jgi:hypothetical protein
MSITDRYRTRREPKQVRSTGTHSHAPTRPSSRSSSARNPPRTHSSTHWKEDLRRLVNFSATVVLSALLSLWLQHQMREFRVTNHPVSRPSEPVSETQTTPEESLADTNSPEPPSSFTVGKMEDLYRKHLEEILHTLRSHPAVRLVKMRLPKSLLNYQRNIASAEDGGTLRLSARAELIPMIAVSQGARRFLDQSLVTYVDPHTIPARMFSTAKLPFSLSALNNFLLIPDLSGPNAGYFTFEH